MVCFSIQSDVWEGDRHLPEAKSCSGKIVRQHMSLDDLSKNLCLVTRKAMLQVNVMCVSSSTTSITADQRNVHFYGKIGNS